MKLSLSHFETSKVLDKGSIRYSDGISGKLELEGGTGAAPPPIMLKVCTCSFTPVMYDEVILES